MATLPYSWASEAEFWLPLKSGLICPAEPSLTYALMAVLRSTTWSTWTVCWSAVIFCLVAVIWPWIDDSWFSAWSYF